MKKLINILVVVNIVGALLMGMKNMFLPSDTLKLFGVDLNSALAHNTFRGSVSAPLIAIGLMVFIGLRTKNKTWYQSALLVVSAIFFGRIYSIIVAGWSDVLVPPLIIEVLSIITLYVASKQLTTSKK